MLCRRWGRTIILAGCLFSAGLGPISFARTALAQLPDDGLTHEKQSQLYGELADEVAGLEKQFGILKKVVKLVSPTVVHIEASKTRQLQLGYGSRAVEEAGSGVIIDMGGKFYVLTNRHVIKNSDAQNIKIKLADGREIFPSRVWSDPGTDVAVLAVNTPRLLAVRLGNSDKMEIGDYVIAVGSPFGLSRSITHGILSAKGRRDLELGEEGVKFQDFMQTDAAINPGNSGGPLINLRGELIGINTAIASSSGGNEGIGFTIPINMVMVIAGQLIDHGSVVRAFLGVNLDSKFGPVLAAKMGLPQPRGARITSVTDKSPASEARLQVDDIILQYDGIPIEDDDHLVNLVGLTTIGKEVPVTVFRDRKVLQMNVKVGDRSRFDAPH